MACNNCDRQLHSLYLVMPENSIFYMQLLGMWMVSDDFYGDLVKPKCHSEL